MWHLCRLTFSFIVASLRRTIGLAAGVIQQHGYLPIHHTILVLVPAHAAVPGLSIAADLRPASPHHRVFPDLDGVR